MTQRRTDSEKERQTDGQTDAERTDGKTPTHRQKDGGKNRQTDER